MGFSASPKYILFLYLIDETFKCEWGKHTNKIFYRSIDLLFIFKFFSMNKTQINKSRMYGATDLSFYIVC